MMLREWTISELQSMMNAGELTSHDLVELYLGRIDALDRNGPKLNSVIETNPDALDIASSLDEERQKGKTRGPLHGIPVLIKGNIDTHDRMQTTAGSLALEGHIAPRDAFIAKKLRSAGAVILGKTNLSEWANFRSKHSVRLRLVIRFSCGGRGKPVRGCCWNGDRRLDNMPKSNEQHRRNQTHTWLVESKRNHPHRPQSGHSRPNGAHRR
jgi:hypothetical protein